MTYLSESPTIYQIFFYDETIMLYKQLFGNENVLVLKYEDMLDDSKKYFSDLSNFINVDVDYNLYDLNKKVNKSATENVASMKLSNFKTYMKNKLHCCGKNIDCDFTDTIMSDELEKN